MKEKLYLAMTMTYVIFFGNASVIIYSMGNYWERNNFRDLIIN